MFETSNIVLGFTGSIGSGCTYISKHLADKSAGQYKYFKLSDIIRNELKNDGKENPTVKEMQIKGNLLRKKHGQDTLAASLLDRIAGDAETYGHIIIDGIKSDKEVALLRQLPNFYLFSVNADREIRKKRTVGADRPFATNEEFLAADKKDEEEKDVNGQQVKKCNHISDIIIVNGTQYTAADTHSKNSFIDDIRKKYIELIENNVADKISPQSSPSVNELCMTIAYSLSKKSSCLKRKVGAVIIDTNDLSTGTCEKSVAQTLPHIIASGYNEVPAGLKKCIFNDEYQKCYRDHLQEMHAMKIKYCPNCGTGVDPKMSCPHCQKEYRQHVKFCDACQKEIKESYECGKCETRVFEEYLPGSKKTPGKLLDLCRALHAEEMAIMQLSKSGGKGTGNLVLFATTQPCNLCANKIATAGIKKVVYAEPYDMVEATTVLSQGKVELERFEGVKSSAYFKLYN
jgi:dCMP deaminase